MTFTHVLVCNGAEPCTYCAGRGSSDVDLGGLAAEPCAICAGSGKQIMFVPIAMLARAIAEGDAKAKGGVS